MTENVRLIKYEVTIEHHLNVIKAVETAPADLTARIYNEQTRDIEDQLMNNNTKAPDRTDKVVEQSHKTLKIFRDSKQTVVGALLARFTTLMLGRKAVKKDLDTDEDDAMWNRFKDTCKIVDGCYLASIRCACRHCRFEKCLLVGMDRNAIQQNRDPIGYTKRTRRYPLIKRAQSSDECSLKDGHGVTLSTAGCTMEQIADVVKRSRKAIINPLNLQEEYDTKKSSGRPNNLNDHEKGKFCGLRRITRSASLESVGLVALMLQHLRCGEC
uniref:Nuclear receptor domain-containing protein n=1 Tax=Heterorhabditis bacteriophora TaxID=37862 RepID=A0A1I7XL56_HETBA